MQGEKDELHVRETLEEQLTKAGDRLQLYTATALGQVVRDVLAYRGHVDYLQIATSQNRLIAQGKSHLQPWKTEESERALEDLNSAIEIKRVSVSGYAQNFSVLKEWLDRLAVQPQKGEYYRFMGLLGSLIRTADSQESEGATFFGYANIEVCLSSPTASSPSSSSFPKVE